MHWLLLWGQKRIEKGAPFFAPLSFCWAFFVYCKNFLYDRGFLRPHAVACPVISIGNIVAGGTGKTPFVHLLASQFQKYRIAILSRGYGKYADEARMLQKKMPFAKVYAGKDRVSLAHQAVQEGAQCIFIDDGFQYRKLHRDIDILLMSGIDLFGKGHFLPWGFLRDSPKRIARADAVFISGKKTQTIAFPHAQVQFEVEAIRDAYGNKIDFLPKTKVGMFCGIAKPYLFRATIEEMGGEIVLEKTIADHAKLHDIDRFAAASQKKGAAALLCTEKDFIKFSMRELQALPCPLWIADVSFRVVEGIDVWQNLIAKIQTKIDNTLNYGT